VHGRAEHPIHRVLNLWPFVFVCPSQVTTLAMTVFVDLIAAVAVGCVMASLLFVKNMANFQINSCEIVTAGACAFDDASSRMLRKEECDIINSPPGRMVLYRLKVATQALVSGLAACLSVRLSVCQSSRHPSIVGPNEE
jgi:MFS superfamily sulfate permease-like transporter